MDGATLSLAPFIPWLSFLAAALAVGTTIWNIVNSGSKRNAERLSGHGQRLIDHDQRITALEQAHNSMPTKDDMHSLHLGIAEMRGDMRELRAVLAASGEVMGRLDRVVTRHEDFLLEGAKR